MSDDALPPASRPATARGRPLPRYRQLADTLRARIAKGELARGQRLPTEAELSAAHGLSRITVRQALDQLTQERLIERFPSRGTFVVDRPQGGSWELQSVNDLVLIGKDTSTRVIAWHEVAPPPPVAAFFGTDARVWRLQAVRMLGDVPLYSVENRLTAALGRQIAAADLADHTLIDLLCNRLGVAVGHASESIGIATATPALARDLWVDPGQPLIQQRLEIFAADGAPLQCGDSWWRKAPFRRRYTYSQG